MVQALQSRTQSQLNVNEETGERMCYCSIVIPIPITFFPVLSLCVLFYNEWSMGMNICECFTLNCFRHFSLSNLLLELNTVSTESCPVLNVYGVCVCVDNSTECKDSWLSIFQVKCFNKDVCYKIILNKIKPKVSHSGGKNIWERSHKFWILRYKKYFKILKFIYGNLYKLYIFLSNSGYPGAAFWLCYNNLRKVGK